MGMTPNYVSRIVIRPQYDDLFEQPHLTSSQPSPLSLRTPLHEQSKSGQHLIQHFSLPTRHLLHNGPPFRGLQIRLLHHLGLILVALHIRIVHHRDRVGVAAVWRERVLPVRQTEEIIRHVLRAGELARTKELVVIAQENDNVERVVGVAFPGTVPGVGQVEVREIPLVGRCLVSGRPGLGGGLGTLGEQDVVEEVQDGQSVVGCRRVDAVGLDQGGCCAFRRFVGGQDDLEALDQGLGEVVRSVAEGRELEDHAVELAVAHDDLLAPVRTGEQQGRLVGRGRAELSDARVRRGRLDDVAVVQGAGRDGHIGELGGEFLGRHGEEGLDLVGGRGGREAERAGHDAEGDVAYGEGEGLDQGVAA